MKYKFDIKNEKVRGALKNRVSGRQPWLGHGRGYERPLELIAAIRIPEFRLAALIQYEGGARAEGVGFPRSPYSKSAVTVGSLGEIIEDPYFRDGCMVGVITTTEKGGYRCEHYVSVATFREVEAYLDCIGRLEGSYHAYLTEVERAAAKTGQYRPGRGTHGLKHAFAYQFLEDAFAAGKTEASAIVELSKRCSHHRGSVALTYYAVRR